MIPVNQQHKNQIWKGFINMTKTGSASTPNHLKKTTQMAATALVTAVICIVSPFTIPIGPIPISLCSLAILLAVYILGTRRACLSVLLYILIGCIGLPVFSGGSGGFAKLAGPTGGYLLGYLFLALISGFFLQLAVRQPLPWLRFLIALFGMLLGTAALYFFGTLWFMFLSGNPLQTALSLCVIPFIPLDLVKILLSALIGPVIASRIAHSL